MSYFFCLGDLDTLEANIANLSGGFGARDNVLEQLSNEISKSRNYIAPRYDSCLESLSTCFMGLHHTQNSFYGRLQEFKAFQTESDELKASMNVIQVNLNKYISCIFRKQDMN